MKVPLLNGSAEDFIAGPVGRFGKDIPAVGEYFSYDSRMRQRIAGGFSKYNVLNYPSGFTQNYPHDSPLNIQFHKHLRGSPKLGDKDGL